jgi:cell division protein FtsL
MLCLCKYINGRTDETQQQKKNFSDHYKLKFKHKCVYFIIISVVVVVVLAVESVSIYTYLLYYNYYMYM